MSIKFKTIPRKNLQKPDDPPMYYAIAAPQGKTDIDGISASIADKSTVSRPDVYAVIIATLETINSELQAGRSVQLGKLGSFSVSISSDPAATPDQVTASSIRKSRVLYRPGAEIRDMLKTLKYEKL